MPDGEHVVPLGKADIKRPGRDATVIATQIMVPRALAAAEQLAADGIEIEVVDPRTLAPLDVPTLAESVARTGRCLVVHEAVKNGGIGAEISAAITESPAFEYLEAPIRRLAGQPVPIPYNKNLERCTVPQEEDIVAAVRNLVEVRA